MDTDEDKGLLDSLGFSKSDSPESTSTTFPPLSIPGQTLNTDRINEKLTKLQSSVDDGFAQVIAKISALNLKKQAGGTRKRKARKSKSSFKKRSLK